MRQICCNPPAYYLLNHPTIHNHPHIYIYVCICRVCLWVPAWCVLVSGTFRCSTAPGEVWGAVAAAAPSVLQASGCTPDPAHTAPGPGSTKSVRTDWRHTHKQIGKLRYLLFFFQYSGPNSFYNWILQMTAYDMYLHVKNKTSIIRALVTQISTCMPSWQHVYWSSNKAFQGLVLWTLMLMFEVISNIRKSTYLVPWSNLVEMCYLSYAVPLCGPHWLREL